MFRRHSQGTGVAAVARQLCGLIGRVEEHGRRAGGTLSLVPNDLAEELNTVAITVATKYTFLDIPDLDELLERQRPGFWVSAVIVHCWALRDLVAFERNPLIANRALQAKKNRFLACTLPWLLSASNVLISPGELSYRLLRALLNTDTLSCYSSIFAGLGNVSPAELEPCLTTYLLLLLIISHAGKAVTGRGVTGRRQSSTATPSVALYRVWLRALSTSAVLEHSAKALLRLQASAKAALAVGSCNVGFVGERLCDARGHFMQVIYSTMEPHLDQPIHSLCPRPLMELGEVVQPDVLATLPLVRQLLSGTCVQFFLGRSLVEARVRLSGDIAPTHGLPAADLQPASLLYREPGGQANQSDPMLHLVNCMSLCTTVWQFTVSGPLPPAVPLGAQVELSLPASMPYSVLAVYELAHEAFSYVIQRAPAATVASELSELVNMARLLARLIAELHPRHAAPRLEPLWRSMSSCLGTLSAANASLFDGMLRIMRSLLVLELAEEPYSAAQHAAQRSTDRAAQHGTGRAARHRAQRQEEQADRGVGGREEPGTSSSGGPASPRTCCPGLRGALDGGFLPSLERRLRGSWSLREGVEPSFGAVNSLLCMSGVWPAVLAHGSFKEVASLIITVRKLGHELARPAAAAAPVPPAHTASTDRPQPLPTEPSLVLPAQWSSFMIILLEATAAVMPQQKRQPGGGGLPNPHLVRRADPGSSTTPASTAGGSSSGRRGGGGAAPPAQEVEEEELPGLDVLIRLGGLPAVRSPATQQQGVLISFAVTHWLPVAMRHMPTAWRFSTDMGRGVARWVFICAVQCLRALNDAQLERGRQEGSGASGSGGGSRAGAGAGPVPAGPRRETAMKAYASWCWFLGEDIKVFDWLAMVLGGQDGSRTAYEELEPTALDILEVLSLAQSENVREGVVVGSSPHRRKGRARPRGGGAAAAAEPRRQLVVEQDVLVRYDRRTLMSVLSATQDEDRSAATAVLLHEVNKKHCDLMRVLPSPREAMREAAAAGIRECCNPGCNNLTGPQESALVAKRCSRCKAVFYCGAACQMAHWRSGHKEDCESHEAPA